METVGSGPGQTGHFFSYTVIVIPTVNLSSPSCRVVAELRKRVSQSRTASVCVCVCAPTSVSQNASLYADRGSLQSFLKQSRSGIAIVVFVAAACSVCRGLQAWHGAKNPWQRP